MEDKALSNAYIKFRRDEMDLIHCPDCSTQVTGNELTCPSCNFPISKLMGLASAILTKDAGMVAGLIQLGADVNAIDKNGRTPLMIASSLRSVEIVQMLLAAGAKPEFENAVGETALKTARSREVEKALRRALVVRRFTSLHQNPPEQTSTPPDPPKVETPKEPVMDLDATQPIPAGTWNAEEISLEAKEAEPDIAQVLFEERITTNPEDVVEETGLISPLIIQESINLEEIEEEVEAIEIEPDPEILEVAETQVITQEPIDLEEIEEEVEAIEIEPDPEVLEVAKAQEEFQPTPVTEKIIETSYEDPYLEFITGQQVHTESTAWENRPQFETLITNEEQIEDEFIEVPDLLESEISVESSNGFQPTVATEEVVEETAFVSPFILQETIEDKSEEPAEVASTEILKQDRVIEDELLEIPNLHEPFISFQLSEQEQVDHLDHTAPGSASAEIQSNFDFEESSMNFNAAQQLHSKFQEYQDWIDLQQPTGDSVWHQEPEIYEAQEEAIDTPELEKTEEPSVVNCLQCGAVIGADDVRCSKCQTTIVRRYCSNCSELIPDHSIFCPYCKVYVTEHFHFVKRGPERFVIGATIGLCILILLMFLTWPTRSSKVAGQGAVRNSIPGQKVPKIAQQDNSEIMFIPPEIKSERKPEPVQAKPSPVKPVEKVKKPITKKSPPVLASVKQRPLQETKTMTVKTPMKQIAEKPPDDEKIKQGVTLSSQGVSLIKQGRPGEAIPLLEQSLRSFPKGTKDVHYATALFNLGVAWRMAGRPDIAIPILQKRIKMNNQRDEVARELNTARQQARDAGFGSFQ